MTGKRSKEELVEQILREANFPNKITPFEITQRLSIGWRSWKELIPKMLEAKLLTERDGSYMTTYLGSEYLIVRAKLKQLIML